MAASGKVYSGLPVSAYADSSNPMRQPVRRRKSVAVVRPQLDPWIERWSQFRCACENGTIGLVPLSIYFVLQRRDSIWWIRLRSALLRKCALAKHELQQSRSQVVTGNGSSVLRPNSLIFNQLLSSPYNSFIFNKRVPWFAKIMAEKWPV